MLGFDNFDWERAETATAIEMVRAGTTRQINALGRSYPWNADPEEVLTAILDRPDCSLGTALTIFVLASPSDWEKAIRDGKVRLGTPSKNPVADEDLSMIARLTGRTDKRDEADHDTRPFALRVCDRINAGEFKPDPTDGPEHRQLLRNYVRRGPGDTRILALDPAIVGDHIDVPSDLAHRRRGNNWEYQNVLNLLSSPPPDNKKR